MTAKARILTVIALGASAVLAQESPTPTATPVEAASPGVSASPAESTTPLPTPNQTPSPARNVRISFVPPPLEGRISLGIYDTAGKLVRVLNRQSALDQFKIGADSLVTQWDGKNDYGEDVPAGTYHARGYLVGSLKVEDIGQTAPSPAENNGKTVRVKLAPNPLANDRRAIIELTGGFDSHGSYLKTNDDLPLLTVNESPNLVGVSITKDGEKSLDIWQTDGTSSRQFRISNVDQMMAFDCGQFELK